MDHNVTIITKFYLSGLTEHRSHRFILFALSFLCYCFILLVNISLIVIIFMDKNLHEPMYILLCIFCVNGLYGTTGFFPKFLWDLLAPVHVISYPGCLIQAQVFSCYVCGELSFLAVMAYDRYVAICQPLQYHSIMSRQKLKKLMFFAWFTPFCVASVNIGLTSRLKLCSPYISRLCCMNWIIVTLACFPAETVIDSIAAYFIIIVYTMHGGFIAWTYMYIIKTCVNSKDNRAKFMQTCVPHLFSLVTFMVTVLFEIMYLRLGSKTLPQDFKNFSAMECLIIPPIMNPLIYGFKLSKVRTRFQSIFTVKSR